MPLTDKLMDRNGVTYVYLKLIGNAIGYEFVWDNPSKTANMKKDNIILAIQPNNKLYSKLVKGSQVTTYNFRDNTLPQMIDSKIYVPLENFITLSGGMVSYDKASKTYNIVAPTNLKYQEKVNISDFAGTGTKGNKDGNASAASFSYLQGVCSVKDKTYILDSGKIKVVEGGKVTTLNMEPANIKPIAIKKRNDDVYIISKAYTNNKKEQEVGIFKVENDNKYVEVAAYNAKEAQIIDFDVAQNKTMYIIRHDLKGKKRYLDIINLKTKTKTSKEIDANFKSLACNDTVAYLGKPAEGTIYSLDTTNDKLEIFAGVAGTHDFDDEKILFSTPKKLAFYNNELYVQDFNLLRRISIDSSGKASRCVTFAGQPTVNKSVNIIAGAGKNTTLSATNPIAFDVSDNGILYVDANVYKVFKIK